MSAIEVKGKSVDEAIFNGLNQLGMSIDEVVIEILKDGSKGFLGFGKTAEVRLTPKVDIPGYIEDEEVKPEMPPREKRPQKKKSPRIKEEAEETEFTPVEYEYTDSCEGEKFLSELMVKMALRAECKTVKHDNEEIDKVVITGEDTALLIGRRGETLDALQYLTGLVVNKNRDDYRKIMIDTENYRAKREDTLVRLANRIAGKVARTGKKVTLEPMNPYERRVLHYTLQNHPKVETVSEGEDPYRRVVIRLKRKG